MSQEGDWLCIACQHVNFKKRDACQRCNCPKYASEADAALYGRNKSEVLPGDWYCNACCAHNYASRTNCYRCGASKSGYFGLGAGMVTPGSYGYDASVLPGYKTGDWICNRLVDNLTLTCISSHMITVSD